MQSMLIDIYTGWSKSLRASYVYNTIARCTERLFDHPV